MRPTVHPALPAQLNRYWLVPPDGWRPGPATIVSASSDLAHAGDLIALNQAAKALLIIRPTTLKPTPLYHYALYNKGLAELALERFEPARQTFAGLRALAPAGYLSEGAALKEAEAAEALNDSGAAVALYEAVLLHKPAAPDTVLMRLARAAQGAGDGARALRAYERVYYEWPTTDAGDAAAQALASLRRESITAASARFKEELARAERLFTARRFAQAREGFEPLLPHATGEVAERIQLRLAECDYSLRRYQRAKDALAPLLPTGAYVAEARYYAMLAARGLGADDEYTGLARKLIDEFPTSSWAEDALSQLASHWIVANEDEQADQVFHELVARFPAGRYSERAYWKIGWWAYRHDRYQEAASAFDRGAVTFPRSDYRPSYLYWAGRACEQLGSREAADVRLLLAVADYANTYYGRLAAGLLRARHVPVPAGADAARRFAPELPAPAPDAAADVPVETIRWLISAEMYDEALDEVQFAERTGGPTPVLQATRAWLLSRRGDLRPAITLMRQAYPQVLAAGGETIPDAVLKIMFPLDYWPALRKYAALHDLDPYLVAALVAQESTFDPNVKSAANAVGLMQILPSTGRRYARIIGLRGFTAKQLTVPEINIRIGTAIFGDLIRRFGGEHIALCGYNAGDSRAAQWAAKRPGMPRDEFVDDIPFPETQNYVRRILGTADDYRRLYGGTDAATRTRPPK
ncbi:MAG: transglycosylase SLT domain-containing protein [Acidobacteria bacterium]|nr:transglycosylase SLT domain-containing protein [Acidobacteriota bacterium]